MIVRGQILGLISSNVYWISIFTFTFFMLFIQKGTSSILLTLVTYCCALINPEPYIYQYVRLIVQVSIGFQSDVI